jgi:PAS domain S-box-containing protein
VKFEPRLVEHAERATHPGDAQFRLLVSKVADLAIYIVDPDGRVMSWNAGAERIKGYRADEVVGREFAQFYPPEDRAAGRPQQALARAAAAGHFESEGWRLRKDGSRFWAEVAITALRDERGELTGFAKVTRDMTERHREREREQFYAATFDQAPNGIFITDAAGGYIGANAAFLRMLGYTEDELRAKTVLEVTHPEDAAESRRIFHELITGAVDRIEVEKRYLRRDGSPVWVRVTAAAIIDGEGVPTRVVSQVEDLTARLATQIALADSERRFELLVQGVTDYAICMLTPQGEITSWNAGAERIKGYAAADVLGRSFAIFFTAEDRANGKPEHALETARAGGRFAYEGWRLRKDGSRFWASVVLDAVHDEAGRHIGFAKITRDLTERRAAEEELREREARLHAFTAHSPSAMFLKGIDGRYRFVNQRFLERHGLRREQVLGHADAELFPAQQARALSRDDADVIARRQATQYEESTSHGGAERIALVSKFPVFTATGAVSGVGGIATDITDLKLAERAAQESRALLAEAQKIAGLGSWEWDPQSGRLGWSDELYRIYGLARESFAPSFEAYLERVHPEDRQHSGAMVARALMDGRPFTLQERIVRPGGEVRYVRSHGEVLRNARGKPLKVLGACLDVTEQRHSESALRQAAQDLHALTRRLVQAEEAERRRIARELHDRVGQSLSALNINLDIVLGKLEGPPELRVRLLDSVGLVERTLESIEGVMAELRPPLLDEYGLAAALGWYAEDFSRRTGIQVAVSDAAGEAGSKAPAAAAVSLFRIAQEALNNVLKHAHAKSAQIELSASSGHLVLAVRDDGAGFDPAAAPRGRWGMGTMRERAEAAGGGLEVQSAPGAGTVVRARVPVQTSR